MTRIGINPARGKFSSYRPARVSVAMLTYIPHLSGYFQHRLDILDLSLRSLITNTIIDYDLIVCDNGSCEQVVEYLLNLRDEGKIEILILSKRNLGKIGALKVLLNAAPGDYMAYTDDDIFFYPGWLEAQLEIIESYPNVGMVSGVPVKDASDRTRTSLIKWIESGDPSLSVSYEKRIPKEWEIDWALSTGRDPEEHIRNIQAQSDVILEYKGLEAFGSASHFQFVSPKDAIIKALLSDWSGKLMGHMMELDKSIDALGYLRLSTMDRFTRHMGNMLSPAMVSDARSLGFDATEHAIRTKKTQHWLLRLPGTGRLMRAIYDRLFRILN